MLCYNTSTEKTGFYYDKIRINTDLAVRDLRKLFPPKWLREETHSWSFGRASEAARNWGFKSRIELVAPTRNCIISLSKALNSKKVKISYLELAKDVFFKTKREAEVEAYNAIKTLRKKYTTNHFIYDQNFRDDVTPTVTDRGLFSMLTGYFGSRNFKYAIYPRYSKINMSACVHTEWRISGASLIAKKTRIKSLFDLLFFDIEKFFEASERKFIAHEYIDRNKLGKWLRGWMKRKKFSKRNQISIGIASAIFMNVHKIKSYVGLVHFLKKRKQEIKKRRGRKTKWQKKYASLTDYSRFRSIV